MSDTKILNNKLDVLNERLDHVERQKVELEQKLAETAKTLASVRSENTRLRAVSRDLAGQVETIGTGLTDLHKAASQASEDNPGNHRHAARVRQAMASLDVFNAATGGPSDA
jgi:septal ring factor EnvC (AmiA/AmiB activator)